jgi:hypothetical protein
LTFFVKMKHLYICILLFFISTPQLHAQEVDTIPIPTEGRDIKLKKSPLYSKEGVVPFNPVKIKPIVVDAKVNYWKTKTSIGININQASFSDNWKNGGVNSLALAGLLNYKAEYSKESFSFVSETILNYGKVKNKDQLQKKTVDRLFWDNKAAFQISKNWYFFGSVNFTSQFDNGYTYSRIDGRERASINPISRFMAPGYLTESIGFEYKPVKYFSSRIGTGTARQTFVLDTAVYYVVNHTTNAVTKTNTQYGVDLGKKFKNELAFQIVNNFDKEIFKNLNLKARYEMFIPYDNFGHIDHRLDVEVRAKINRFMNVSVVGVGLYDRDQEMKIQGSQTMALGITFIIPR